MKRLCYGLLAACAVAALAVSASAETITAATCRGDSVASVGVQNSNAADFVTTTSDVWSNVRGLTAQITTQGAVADCAVVTWVGSVRAGSGTVEGVRAVVDGQACRPSGILVADSGQHERFESSSGTFICDNVAKGTHTVNIQFRTKRDGVPVDMRRRGFRVDFKGQ
jgi:hypothetical protein